MRLGIYGGSFDPIHYGHLLLAECCREQAALDEVWFMPSAVSPHKRNREMTPAKMRAEMIELALGGHGSLKVSLLEIERGGLSYTYETLGAIHAERPTDELFLLMGADTLADLPRWRQPAEILRLASPLAVSRHGSSAPDYSVLARVADPARLQTFSANQVEMPIIELSGTEIRSRVRAGRSIRFQTPRAVEKYIETHGLYR